MFLLNHGGCFEKIGAILLCIGRLSFRTFHCAGSVEFWTIDTATLGQEPWAQETDNKTTFPFACAKWTDLVVKGEKGVFDRRRRPDLKRHLASVRAGTSARRRTRDERVRGHSVAERNAQSTHRTIAKARYISRHWTCSWWSFSGGVRRLVWRNLKGEAPPLKPVVQVRRPWCRRHHSASASGRFVSNLHNESIRFFLSSDQARDGIVV